MCVCVPPPLFFLHLHLHWRRGICPVIPPTHRDLPQDFCPVYRPGEWEQLPSERDLNPFSRYEALDPKRPIVLDDFGSGKGVNYCLCAKCVVTATFHYHSVFAALSITTYCPWLILNLPANTEEEQAEKSPSDEGFTELEPTVNGSTEDREGLSSITAKNQQEVGPCQSEDENKSNLDSNKEKLDEDEDEGVAQTSSIEDGESLQSALEAEKLTDKPTKQELMETRDIENKGTEEQLNRTSTGPVDLNRQLSLSQGSGVLETSSMKTQSPDRPTSGSQMSEVDRHRESYEAEMKSWLLQRMQAPIEGRNILVGVSTCE